MCVCIQSLHNTNYPAGSGERAGDGPNLWGAKWTGNTSISQPYQLSSEAGVLYRKAPSQYTGHSHQLAVPAELVPEFLAYFHNGLFGGHLGRMKTLLRILVVAWWPSIWKDVWNHVRACQKCQAYKSSNEKPAGQIQQSEVKAAGEMIGVDFMGPFPLSKSRNTMLMVVVDYYTKWVELFLLKDAKTPRVRKIFKDDIFTRWGVPAYMVSDCGPQFTSQIMSRLCQWQWWEGIPWMKPGS